STRRQQPEAGEEGANDREHQSQWEANVHSGLLKSDYGLQTTDYGLQTSDFRMAGLKPRPTAHRPTAYRLLPTAYRLLPTAYYQKITFSNSVSPSTIVASTAGRLCHSRLRS